MLNLSCPQPTRGEGELCLTESAIIWQFSLCFIPNLPIDEALLQPCLCEK